MITTMFVVVIVLAIIGVGWFLLERYVLPQIAVPIKIAIRTVLTIGVIVYLLKVFGIWGRY